MSWSFAGGEPFLERYRIISSGKSQYYDIMKISISQNILPTWSEGRVLHEEKRKGTIILNDEDSYV